MDGEKTETILIIDRMVEPAGAPGGRSLQARGIYEGVVQATERAVEDVRQNMTRFITGVQKILAEGAAIGGEFAIAEVEVSAQVTAEGKIGFAGTGMNLKGDSGLKIIFRRQKADGQGLTQP